MFSTTISMLMNRPILALAGALLSLTLPACGASESDPPSAAPEATTGDLTEQLEPNAGPEAIVAHLLTARQNARTTRALAQQYPDLDRATAYQIQHLNQQSEVAAGGRRTGWKLGGTRMTEAGAQPDPIFGYSMDSDVFQEGTPIDPNRFVNGAPMVEAEIAIWIGKDLPGPEVSREELLDAVDSVGGAIELVAPRVLGAGDEPPPLNHVIADDVSHAGVVFGQRRVPVEDVDFDAEVARVEVNGVEAASGAGSQIMGEHGTALDAVLWLANELPKHGMHLRTGEYVVTGSLYDNPTLQPGDRAVVSFTTLGTIDMSLAQE